jgi:hypothetical protein
MGPRRLVVAVVCALAGVLSLGLVGVSTASPVRPVDDTPIETPTETPTETPVETPTPTLTTPIESPVLCDSDELEPLAMKAESCRSITFGIAVENGKWKVMVRDNIGDIGVADGSTIDPDVPGKASYTLTVVLTDPDPAKMTCVFDGIYVPGGSGVGSPEVKWTLKDGKYQLTIKVDGKLIDPGQGGKQEGYRIFARCKPNNK